MRVISFGKWLISRSLSVYLITSCGFFITFNIPSIIKNINLSVLNRLRPASFEPLVRGNVRNYQWDEYERYYKKVSAVLPERADALGLYAYVKYMQGNKLEALKIYKKAAGLNDQFFWFYFNPGLIHFANHDYKKAIELFENAVAVNRDLTFRQIIASRRLYLPLVLQRDPQPQRAIIDIYKQDYTRAIQLMKIARYAVDNNIKLDLSSLNFSLKLSLF